MHDAAIITRLSAPHRATQVIQSQFKYPPSAAVAARIYAPFAVEDDTRFVHRFHHEDTRGRGKHWKYGRYSLVN
jgi:hypothetical protein